ncbi:hypothetical protein EG68_03567 [Paragonimus skrjabini miyazakii]|uniref:UPAR/Ly6 domain-containing protein n=1 Tax=Paragonimus skrjabini miyazakii TaxID=59628 RepID=A0A8S9Z0J0_9TREM|nr:hypothetical protein EG68_03567 [Paragonimus skrjabini miyazakii]
MSSHVEFLGITLNKMHGCLNEDLCSSPLQSVMQSMVHFSCCSTDLCNETNVRKTNSSVLIILLLLLRKWSAV